MKSKLLWIMMIGFLLGACSLPARTNPDFAIDVTDPPHGMIFTLSSIPSLVVRTKSGSLDGGAIVRIIYYANGLVIGTDSSVDPAVGDSSIEWAVPAPGEYFLQAEAQRAHDSVLSAAVRVCVIEGINIIASGYTGPCPIPPSDPSAPLGGSVDMTTTTRTTSIAYPWDGCPTPAEYTISFEARLSDISDLAALVYVNLRIVGDPAAPDSYDGIVAMNWTGSAPTGEKIFTGSTIIQSQAFVNVLQGEIGSLEWAAGAVGRDNVALVDETPHSIPAGPCDPPVIGVPMPIVIEPTDTLAPTATSTATLIPYVPPTSTKKPKGGNDNGGGDTSGGSGPVCKGLDEKSCNATAGCTWDGSGCNVK
jgi:hypothetical protein